MLYIFRSYRTFPLALHRNPSIASVYKLKLCNVYMFCSLLKRILFVRLFNWPQLHNGHNGQWRCVMVLNTIFFFLHIFGLTAYSSYFRMERLKGLFDRWCMCSESMIAYALYSVRVTYQWEICSFFWGNQCIFSLFRSFFVGIKICYIKWFIRPKRPVYYILCRYSLFCKEIAYVWQ